MKTLTKIVQIDEVTTTVVTGQQRAADVADVLIAESLERLCRRR